MVAHPTILRGAGAAARVAGPLILQRAGDDFVPALLDELGDQNGFASVAATRATPRAGSATLTLFQPVHRVYHLALLEVVCDTPGFPRLDPAKIESAGMVLRRRARADDGTTIPGALEGWMQEAPNARSRAAGTAARRTLRGWLRLDGASDPDRDPDPEHRRDAPRSGHEAIDRGLAALLPDIAALAEQVAPLFVAPPEVCAATGKTLLYGLVPVTSADNGKGPETQPPFSAEETDTIRANLPQLLRAGMPAALPKPGDFVTRADATAATPSPEMTKLVEHLRRIAGELDAFGEGPEARALFAALNELPLQFFDDTVWPPGTTAAAFAQLTQTRLLNEQFHFGVVMPGLVQRPAGEWLRDAVSVLVKGEPPGTVRMPLVWPTITTTQQERFVAASIASMTARLKTLVPRAGRFSDPSRQFRLRAFVRVKGENGCPPRLVWSDYSEPFSIAPWYEPSDAPPTVIPLPKPDFKSLKPNVAFAVPADLAKLLNQDAKALVKGEGGPGSGLTVDWICSISIPIITLCAFIVLNIFLSLFDLIFAWMLFIKLCIPIPRPK